jgi:hypothetical protein
MHHSSDHLTTSCLNTALDVNSTTHKAWVADSRNLAVSHATLLIKIPSLLLKRSYLCAYYPHMFDIDGQNETPNIGLLRG